MLRTNTSTPGPSTALLRSHAAAQSRAVEVTAVVRPDAYQALFAGNRDRHDAIVTEAALAVAPAAAVIVLAQASLAHLQPALARDTGRPVLSNPPLLMQEIGRRLQGGP